jgi:hypothetical protein
MVKFNQITEDVAKELGLDKELVDRIARVPWRFTKEFINKPMNGSVMHIYLGKFYIKKKKKEILESQYLKHEQDEWR